LCPRDEWLKDSLEWKKSHTRPMAPAEFLPETSPPYAR